MKKITFIALAPFLLAQLGAHAQKHVYDYADAYTWRNVEGGKISNDGKTVVYEIWTKKQDKRVMVFQETSGAILDSVDLGSTGDGSFSDDSKSFYFLRSDSLRCYNIGKRLVSLIGMVDKWQLLKQGKSELLVYKEKSGALHLDNLTTGAKRVFDGVQRYFFSGDMRQLLLCKGRQGSDEASLEIDDLSTGTQKNIWSGRHLADAVVSDDFHQVAFSTRDAAAQFWLYSDRAGKAVVVADDTQVKGGYELANIDHFSKDGNRLFIGLKPKDADTADKPPVKVDVYSYLDPVPFIERNKPDNFKAVIDLGNDRMIVLQKPFETISIPEAGDDEWLFGFYKKGGAGGEWSWNKYGKASCFWESAKTGERKAIDMDVQFAGGYSCGGKYFFGYDLTQNGDLWCARVGDTKFVNITNSLPIPQADSLNAVEGFTSARVSRALGRLTVCGWLPNDKKVVVADSYDLWLVDPDGVAAPVCLTGGYGRAYLERLYISGRSYNGENWPVTGDEVLLSETSYLTKQNGLCRVRISKPGQLEHLVMADGTYDDQRADKDYPPMKARDKDIYLVYHEAQNEAPNYFLSKDLKTFTPLTHMAPQENVQWFRTRLMTWRRADNSIHQALMYLPEDFDSTRKYPVIINYYEKVTHALNYFLPDPRFDGATVDEAIPWFVGRGYIVVMPDIVYSAGHPFESAFACIDNATNELVKYPFVDSLHMAIQGHSFGGYETNYIVTRTHRYAAAMGASGGGDLISLYGDCHDQGFVENGQVRMGSSLWENLEGYMNNSALFRADQVTTPLLMMNNAEDPLVPFFQGQEYFSALRRLGKRAWMLQYDGEGHVLYDFKNTCDYWNRVTQFFDHYLKGTPAPYWMTKGWGDGDEGFYDRLKLDMTQKTPGPGLIQ